MSRRNGNAQERGETPSGERVPPLAALSRAVAGARLPLAYLAALVALSLVLFPPTQKKRSVRLEEGTVAGVDVTAPFAFVVPLSDQEIELARAKAALEIPPVYVRDAASPANLAGDLKELFARIGAVAEEEGSVRQRVGRIKDAAPELRREAVELLVDGRIRARMLAESLRLQRQYLDRGIVNDASVLQKRSYAHVTVVADGEESRLAAGGLVDQRDLEDLITAEGRRLFPENERAVRLFHAVLRPYLAPNLLFDAAETKKRREEAMRKIDRSFAVERGSRIVSRHDRVTRRQIEILETMEDKRIALELSTSFGKRLLLYLGKGLRILALVALLALAVRRFDPRTLADRGRQTLAFIALVIYLVLTALVVRLPSLDPHLVPTALVSLVTTAFLGVPAAALFTLFASFVLVTHTALPASCAFVSLLAGAAGILSIAHLRERRSFYTVFLSISAAYVIGAAGFAITEQSSLAVFGRAAAYGTANALVCTVLVMFLLPILESLFDTTTNFTLMELSDLNRPLLRRLIMEAPGTYHHSLMVGNLVETVARGVGANGLEARVGAYYHDIGKLAKPEYFFENAGERDNKHEKLAPRMSALVIVSHVKEGVELARSEKLPRIVTDAISEHHGRTVMAYFYQKALEYDSHDSVNIDDFRYPGPRPRSKETALIMLADSCEAAVRSLRDPTVPKIRAIVQKIIEARMSDGELDESGLTLNDIAVIRERFIQLLTTVFHPRIAYPAQREEPAAGGGERQP